MHVLIMLKIHHNRTIKITGLSLTGCRTLFTVQLLPIGYNSELRRAHCAHLHKYLHELPCTCCQMVMIQPGSFQYCPRYAFRIHDDNQNQIQYVYINISAINRQGYGLCTFFVCFIFKSIILLNCSLLYLQL